MNLIVGTSAFLPPPALNSLDGLFGGGNGSDYAIQKLPPILILPRDVLWYIFSFNADMNWVGDGFQEEGTVDFALHVDDPWRDKSLDAHISRFYALTIARRTSQVCRLWREIMLNSTSIWARIVDLTLLNWARDEWGEEVLRRTGSAPLSLKVVVKSWIGPSFFLSILKDNWTRMREIDVSLYTRDGENTPHQTWQVIERPAPCLERFSARLHSGFIAFTTSAPALREFHVAPYPTFSLQSSWIRQLRILSLKFGYKSHNRRFLGFTISDLLGAFKEMELLEFLMLEWTHLVGANGVAPLSLPRAFLPNLSKISITDDFKTCAALIKHIDYKDECFVDLSADANAIRQDEVPAIQEFIGQLCRSHRFENNLTIEVLSTQFRVFDEMFKNYERAKLSILITFDDFLPGRFIPALLMPLTLCNFQRVTRLHFSTNLLHTFPDDSPTLRELLLPLTALKVLKTTERGFHLIAVLNNKLSVNNVRLFPSLEKLAFPEGDILGKDFIDFFVDFYIWRKAQGLVLRTLDMRGCILEDMVCLEDLSGLVVEWTNARLGELSAYTSYHCGSGSPRRLEFTWNRKRRHDW